MGWFLTLITFVVEDLQNTVLAFKLWYRYKYPFVGNVFHLGMAARLSLTAEFMEKPQGDSCPLSQKRVTALPKPPYVNLSVYTVISISIWPFAECRN